MWKPGQLVVIKAGSGTESNGQPIPDVNTVCRVHKKSKLYLGSFTEFAIGMQRKRFSIIRERCPKDCFISKV